MLRETGCRGWIALGSGAPSRQPVTVIRREYNQQNRSSVPAATLETAIAKLLAPRYEGIRRVSPGLPSDGGFGLDDAPHIHSLLTDYVDAFLDAWEESESPPALAEFLPADIELRRIVLPELVKVDLEYRWTRRGEAVRVEDYVEPYPDLFSDGVPADLVYEEYRLRRENGIRVDVQEYLDRYPAIAERLRGLLQLDDANATSAIVSADSRRLANEVGVGSTIDEFELVAELGAGAFARVFLARQTSMQRMVALKISTAQSDEPQTLAKIDHDYIIRVFDQRTLPERGLRLLYMQYVPGGTLHDVMDAVRDTEPGQRSGRLMLTVVDKQLEKRGEFPPSESRAREELARMSWPETVAWLGIRLARALDHAHRQQVLHRDVKPANVLLSAEGVPKLADFNVSFCGKVRGAAPAAFFGGSLGYMSPEQLEACHPGRERQADQLDGRSDQFSLAVMLWELLFGQRPYHDPVLEGGWELVLDDLLAQRLRGAAAPTATDEPCSVAVSSVLSRALEPEPERRWSSCRELARQLELCLDVRKRKLFSVGRAGRVPSGSRFAAATMAAMLAPNVLAAGFNYAYNRREIIAPLQSAAASFERTQTAVNGIAFPLGIIVCLALLWRIAATLRSAGDGTATQQVITGSRRLCLWLGAAASAVGVALWMLAGIVYPLSIDWGTGELPVAGYAHFFASLVLCGLIAATYPFFGVTWISLRTVYPFLLRQKLSGAAEDRPHLERLQRMTWVFLASGIAVPLLAIATLVSIGSSARIALVVISGVALLSLGPVLWCFSRIQSSLETLLELASGQT
jgi:serine/threonine protein kinase